MIEISESKTTVVAGNFFLKNIIFFSHMQYDHSLGSVEVSTVNKYIFWLLVNFQSHKA